jgi:hypothetical protein
MVALHSSTSAGISPSCDSLLQIAWSVEIHDQDGLRVFIRPWSVELAALLDPPQQIANQEVFPKPGHVATPPRGIANCWAIAEMAGSLSPEYMSRRREYSSRSSLHSIKMLVLSASESKPLFLVIGKLNTPHDRRMTEHKLLSHRRR